MPIHIKYKKGDNMESRRMLLWYSTLELEGDEREDLFKRLGSQFAIKHIPKEPICYADVIEAGAGCDVICVDQYTSYDVLSELTKAKNNQKPVIRKAYTLDAENNLVFEGWESVEMVIAITKPLIPPVIKACVLAKFDCGLCEYADRCRRHMGTGDEPVWLHQYTREEVMSGKPSIGGVKFYD